MDKVTRYGQILQKVIEESAAMLSQGNQVAILPVCDPVHGQYLLISLGWQSHRREHAIVFHAQLRESRIFIEVDGTEEGIANLLLQAGVEEDDIRLAWADAPRSNEQATIAA